MDGYVANGNQIASKLMNTKITCGDCGAVFTFEEGANLAIKNGRKGNVVECPRCGSVFVASFGSGVVPTRPAEAHEDDKQKAAVAGEGPVWLRLLLALGVILSIGAAGSFVMMIVSIFSLAENFGIGQVAFVLAMCAAAVGVLVLYARRRTKWVKAQKEKAESAGR